MLNVKKVLTKVLEKIIFEHISDKYITVGNFALCWGTGTSSGINADNTVTFPIAFASTPVGFATWHKSATGSVYNQLTVHDESTTTMKVYFYQSGGAAGQFNWLAIGFIGGGYFLKVFSRLAERRWEYAEREENSYQNNGTLGQNHYHENVYNIVHKCIRILHNRDQRHYGRGIYADCVHADKYQPGGNIYVLVRSRKYGIVRNSQPYRWKHFRHNNQFRCDIHQERLDRLALERGWSCA